MTRPRKTDKRTQPQPTEKEIIHCMNEENKLAVRAALEHGAELGEKALVAIADVSGDGAAKEIIEALTDAEVASVAGEFDMTMPSLVHNYATPDQFVGAFGRFGRRWTVLDTDEIGGTLRTRQREMEAFLCPMLCHQDDARTAAMFAALAGHELAADALVFAGLDRPGYAERLADPSSTVVCAETFEEIYAKTSELAPDLWEEVKLLAEDLQETEEKLEFAAEFCTRLHDWTGEGGAETQVAPEETFLGI